ncbi:hypothetical protein JW877_05035 [bacterium]|nr:hypothetical protein [bacterium]
MNSLNEKLDISVRKAIFLNFFEHQSGSLLKTTWYIALVLVIYWAFFLLNPFNSSDKLLRYIIYPPVITLLLLCTYGLLVSLISVVLMVMKKIPSNPWPFIWLSSLPAFIFSLDFYTLILVSFNHGCNRAADLPGLSLQTAAWLAGFILLILISPRKYRLEVIIRPLSLSLIMIMILEVESIILDSFQNIKP